MNPGNQKEYWNKVAAEKTFTHPLDMDWLTRRLSPGALVVDFGCGYGRMVRELMQAGFSRATGFDTSLEMIHRAGNLPVHFIENPSDLPLEEESVDCFLLMAVLTCIPFNADQQSLVDLLRAKLSPGGLLLVSDYYLQAPGLASGRYHSPDEDDQGFGVFSLPDGALLRHHPPAWIERLFQDFRVVEKTNIQVSTMNGNPAEVFQLLLKK